MVAGTGSGKTFSVALRNLNLLLLQKTHPTGLKLPKPKILFFISKISREPESLIRHQGQLAFETLAYPLILYLCCQNEIPLRCFCEVDRSELFQIETTAPKHGRCSSSMKSINHAYSCPDLR